MARIVTITRSGAIRSAALTAVAALGLLAGAPKVYALDAHPAGPAIERRFDLDITDDRIADAQRRVDAAQRRLNDAKANLDRVREPAMNEMENSPEFRRATGDADAAEDRLNDEISRVLDRLSQDNPEYRRARARRVASDYIPELRESDERAARVDDKIHAMEHDALDADRRVRDARADATDANKAIDDLLARYEDRLRDRPDIADATDRFKAEQRALADATADLQDAQDRLAGGPAAEDDRYTPPPREVVDTYERDLSPSGRWVDVPNYGRCFVPSGIDKDWRPYTNGRWSHGDDGWAWVADDNESSWGEICYHYGRWTRDDRVGWAWVPGTVWAPAWVAWREGGDYCGWAPLPPEGGLTVSLSIADRIPATSFNFCEQKYLGEPRVRDRIVPAERTTTIINNTVNITNVTVVNNRIVNRGVDVARVERLSGHRVEQAQIATASTAVEAKRLRSEGKVVRFEPPVVQKAAEERLAQHQRVVQRAAAERPAAPTAAAPAGNRAPAARTNETPGVKAPARTSESTGTVATPNSSTAANDRTAERERAVERERAARSGAAAKPAVGVPAGVTPSAPSNTAEHRPTATPAAPDAATATRTERERAAERDRASTATGQPVTPTPSVPSRTTEHDRAVERERAARSGTAAKPADDVPTGITPSVSSNTAERRPTSTTRPGVPEAATATRTERERAAERDRASTAAGQPVTPTPSVPDRTTERERAAARASGTPGDHPDTARPDRATTAERASGPTGTATDSTSTPRRRTASTTPTRTTPTDTTDTAGRDRTSTPAERDRTSQPARAVVPPASDRERTTDPARPSATRERSSEAPPAAPAPGETPSTARDRASERDRATRSAATAPSSDTATSAHDRAVAREKARQTDSNR